MKYDILPLRTAFLWIAASAVIVSGSAAVGLWLYKWQKQQAATDDKYKIIAILQHTNDPEPLQNIYLAELLNLSIDKPAYLTAYSTTQAEFQLLRCPHIKSVSIKKIPPGTLYIDYVMRRPAAFLAGYTNVSIDREGIAIPFKPFYTPKNLPELVLGDIEGDVLWGSPVRSGRLEQALAVLEYFEPQCSRTNTIIKRIDVSRLDAPSAGQREILVVVEEAVDGAGPSTRFLRLGIGHYERDLQNYWSLRDYVIAHPDEFPAGQIAIDLRVPQLAFLSPVH